MSVPWGVVQLRKIMFHSVLLYWFEQSYPSKRGIMCEQVILSHEDEVKFKMALWRIWSSEKKTKYCKEWRNVTTLHTIRSKKFYYTSHIICSKYLLKHGTEGKRERSGRRRGWSKQLLDDLKETRKYSKLRKKALDHTLSRTRFGRGCALVIRQTTWLWCMTFG
jgi:hypothetical protein